MNLIEMGSVKSLPAMQETWVQSLSQEDLLEREMATHSNILAWEIPWTEEPGGLQSMGSQGGGNDRATKPTYLPKGSRVASGCHIDWYRFRLSVV